ncbi:MAG: SRPBCC family protein [Acidimicrobiales bacterium]|nr:SRPBCC family protein [Acidimicrobiales bacterium]
MEIRSEHTHHVGRSVDEVWDAINRVDDYRVWWPWLRRFAAEGVVEGDEWRCTVQPPLPYSLRFTISIDDVEIGPDERRVAATVAGDIVGTATLRLSPSDRGCAIDLGSVLRPDNRALQVVSKIAPWMARSGHDWVIRTGLHQFRRRAW